MLVFRTANNFDVREGYLLRAPPTRYGPILVTGADQFVSKSLIHRPRTA
jgi:hypothetical protein